jgi:hypothetical protein
MRTAAVAFNEANPKMWADVLATENPNGSSLTFYRRVTGEPPKQVERLFRSTITHDSADDTEPGTMFSTPPSTEEQQAIEACLTALRAS